MALNTSNIPPTFIFIDGSYFCFYRYHSLLNWWKNAYPEEPLADPFQCQKFVDKFIKTFIENVEEIPKKLGLHKEKFKPIIIVGKDCKREQIWRTKLFPEYKGTRVKEDGFMGGPFFKMAYEDNLFGKGGAKAVLKHPHLEADDCIAISVKHVLNNYPDAQIYIITSDKDYLQLAKPNVQIYSLAYKKLTDQKSSTGNSECDLFCKIVMGDISDNIKSVLKKCGPKTALKCYENRAYFDEKMKTENAYELYKLNETLVDFNKIPQQYVDEFLESLKS
jgi:5'-3' exonuclease